MHHGEIEAGAGREEPVDSGHARVVIVGVGVDPHVGDVLVDCVRVVNNWEGREIIVDLRPC